MRRFVMVAALCVAGHAAQAQGLNFAPIGYPPGNELPPGSTPILSGSVNGSTDYVRISRIRDGVIDARQQTGFISVSNFLSAVQAQNGAAMSQTLTAVAARIDRLNDRFSEGIALAGAINVLPPNPGDRFAVSLGGAGYNGAGAGSISVSARLGESGLVYGAIARGPSETLVKGGVGWSFR